MFVEGIVGFEILALMMAVGVAVTWLSLVPAVDLPQDEAARVWRATWCLLVLCLAILWLTGFAWLWARTAAVSGRDAWSALSVVPTVLFHTHFGKLWWIRLAALVWSSFVMFWLFRGGWRRTGLVLMLAGLAWIGASHSATGHAAADGDWTLREGMDWLHLVSVSLWGGSLMATLLLVFPRMEKARPTARAVFARRFSLLATWALAGVLVTGIYSAWHMLPAFSDLWRSHYGRLLVVKLLFVADMVILGAINHYSLVPDLKMASDATNLLLVRRLRLTVLMEAGLLLFVLATTSMLLGSSPPMG